MKLKRRNGSKDALKTAVELAAAVERGNLEGKYSMSLEFALTELVREEMRVLAQDTFGGRRSTELLLESIRRVVSQIDSELHDLGIELDLRRYEKQVRGKLRFPAIEMQKLGNALAQSREGNRLGAKSELSVQHGRTFIVHELGLRDAIQGILVEPNTDVGELNVEALHRTSDWQVHGEWFPYEVHAEEFVLVVDDDGSIFVSTEGLPRELRDRAYELVHSIANVLFD